MAISFLAEAGERLDHFLQTRMSGYSRARIQAWIKDGLVSVNGAPAKPSTILRGGERIEVSPANAPPLKAEPEDAPIEILYEDAAVIAVNKPAGLVVHAGAGAHSGTLVNRLVHHFQSLSQVGGELRPGIVHRLDRGTSGVMLVARTDAAHRALAAQFSGAHHGEDVSGAGGGSRERGFRAHYQADRARSGASDAHDREARPWARRADRISRPAAV